jgi:PIN domain nuclease of toxin-antitoxin system
MMRVLLDTNILIWALIEPSTLDPVAYAMLADRKNEIYFSAASIWEIAIKRSKSQPEFQIDADMVARSATLSGFIELPITAEVASRVVDLSMHHKDPFDRLLIMQAILGPYQFYTSDKKLPVYTPLVTLIDPPRD